MIERCVCAPQYRSTGTSNGPKLSVSVRVLVMNLSLKNCFGQGLSRVRADRKQALFAELVQTDDIGFFTFALCRLFGFDHLVHGRFINFDDRCVFVLLRLKAQAKLD